MPEDKDKIIIEVKESQFEEEKAKKPTIRVLGFSLGEEHYCVDIKQAKEVIRVTQITRVPNTPEFIIGVTNLRGEVLALFDIKYFLGLEQKERTKDMRVVVSDVSGSAVGFLVDKVDEAMDIELDALQPPLSTLTSKVTQYTRGQIQAGLDIIIFLDLEKILNCEEIEKLRREK